MNIAWYYYDRNSERCYYTESYSMSVTEFADLVSSIIGRRISASDTSAATSQKELDRFNAEHIYTEKSIKERIIAMFKYYKFLNLNYNGETRCAICGAWCQGFKAPAHYKQKGCIR